MSFKTIIIDDCFYKEKVLGQTFVNYLTSSLEDYVVLSSLSEIKEEQVNTDYFLVLYSSYPLIKKDDIIYIADYAINKNLSICNFNGGFFVKKEYFFNKNHLNTLSSELHFDYSIGVKDNYSLHTVYEILRKQIIEKHINSGVIFNNTNTVIIDYNVSIASGVKIGNCCEIYGNSEIQQNCEVLSFCVLNNVVLKDNCKLFNCKLKDMVVEENKELKNFNNF